MDTIVIPVYRGAADELGHWLKPTLVRSGRVRI